MNNNIKRNNNKDGRNSGTFITDVNYICQNKRSEKRQLELYNLQYWVVNRDLNGQHWEREDPKYFEVLL